MVNFSEFFRKAKYGFFVHFVAKRSAFSDGRLPVDADEAVNSFDVKGFADDIEKMGVQYLIFTAWHYQIITLYPSKVNEKWRPGSSTRRDLLGEIIDEITSRGIKMILYTHPRDGHDLVENEKIITGWGKNSVHPEGENFDYEKWNEYMLALYEELFERYGEKISGIYTDGMGPFFPWKRGELQSKIFPWETSGPNRNTQVVNYLAIRKLLKEKNTSAFMIQNYFGQIYSDDFAMSEGYDSYEKTVLEYKNIEKWPVAKKAYAFTVFSGGWASGLEPRGKDAKLMNPDDMLRFTIFNASCTEGGGVCWASGPYCEGNVWQINVVETMEKVGNRLKKYAESVLEAVPSRSLPTLSNDTLEKLDYKFFTESEDGRYEYLHIMKMPDDMTILIPKTIDGARLSVPACLNGGLTDIKLTEDKNGYILKLTGAPDEIDTVIRFVREDPVVSYACEWVNDADKRLRYIGKWNYSFLIGHKSEMYDEITVNCYEVDYHYTDIADASVFLAFEGSFIEIYGIRYPEYGLADVYIDGIKVGEINEFADELQTKVRVFKSEYLGGGIHTLEIVVRGGKVFKFDAVKVTK